MKENHTNEYQAGVIKQWEDGIIKSKTLTDLINILRRNKPNE